MDIDVLCHYQLIAKRREGRGAFVLKDKEKRQRRVAGDQGKEKKIKSK